MRYAARVDGTHREVIDALRACGWLVADTSRLAGFVDCVAQRRGVTRLIEIKRPKGKLTWLQAQMIAAGFDVRVLRSAEDAARLQ